MRFGRHIAAIASASVALLADASAALAGNGGFAPVPPESPNAEGISQSWWFVTAFVLAIFLLVEVLLVVFVVRYRRRNRPRDADGAQVHGANRLEIAWTIAPVVILFAIAAFVFAKLPGHPGRPRCDRRRGEPRRRGDRHAVHVGVPLPERRRRDRPAPRARGANGRARGDRARLGRRALLVDPGARRQDRRDPRQGEHDVVPRRSASGVFLGQCAELCGIYHAKMLAIGRGAPGGGVRRVARRARASSRPPARRRSARSCGRARARSATASTARAGTGRGIAGTELVEDPEALEKLLREGRGAMPPVGRGLGRRRRWTR